MADWPPESMRDYPLVAIDRDTARGFRIKESAAEEYRKAGWEVIRADDMTLPSRSLGKDTTESV